MKDVPLRPVLSLPEGSPTFDKRLAQVLGADIETNTQEAPEVIEKDKLDYRPCTQYYEEIGKHCCRSSTL